jgi:large subunit ribosomal protein L31
MKKDIHPQNYRPVIFEDSTVGTRFLISSVVDTKDTGKWEDGKEYPLYKVEISSASHPFYTGTENVIDTAGRIDKFKARAGKKIANSKK